MHRTNLSAVKQSTAISSQSVGSRLSSNTTTFSRQGSVCSVVTSVNMDGSNPASSLSTGDGDIPLSRVSHG